MSVPVRTALRRSCREASGVVILSRLPMRDAGWQTLRQRRQLARIRVNHGGLPLRLNLWQRLCRWCGAYFKRSGAIKMF
ncbi:hypothetical protein [Chromobacterium sp. IIBBL 290-4]|uniref:hypothetical protein n=1 Tax=Chromobacterium sp. IIBBL 290-4 TaxID=2953890 RepID=UPI0020B75D87|nr:hypothetical protein [Chromobacterium sp. IIBBL 290-4]UTH76056.1 hypothetical protein NKT35_08090 [Chromobacterium sp. IIBBL 290-4]